MSSEQANLHRSMRRARRIDDNRLKGQIKELIEENEELKELTTTCVAELASAVACTIRELKAENEDLQLRAPMPLEYYENAIGNLETDIDDLKGQIDELKEENEALKELKTDCMEELASAAAGTIRKLKEENEKLKDFANWENHPALKHKVVMDDDFYLEHLVDGELIEPEEFTSLKEENKKLMAENKELKEHLELYQEW